MMHYIYYVQYLFLIAGSRFGLCRPMFSVGCVRVFLFCRGAAYHASASPCVSVQQTEKTEKGLQSLISRRAAIHPVGRGCSRVSDAGSIRRHNRFMCFDNCRAANAAKCVIYHCRPLRRAATHDTPQKISIRRSLRRSTANCRCAANPRSESKPIENGPKIQRIRGQCAPFIFDTLNHLGQGNETLIALH